MSDGISRRTFLQNSAVAAAGCVGCVALLNGGCDSGGPGTTGAAVATDSTRSALLAFSDTRFAPLQSANGSARVTITDGGVENAVSVARVSDTVAHTVSLQCTHDACNIGDYEPAAMQYTCPCHGSRFSVDGTRLAGPANRPLPSFTTTIEATGIRVSFA